MTPMAPASSTTKTLPRKTLAALFTTLLLTGGAVGYVSATPMGATHMAKAHGRHLEANNPVVSMWSDVQDVIQRHSLRQEPSNNAMASDKAQSPPAAMEAMTHGVDPDVNAVLEALAVRTDPHTPGLMEAVEAAVEERRAWMGHQGTAMEANMRGSRTSVADAVLEAMNSVHDPFGIKESMDNPSVMEAMATETDPFAPGRMEAMTKPQAMEGMTAETDPFKHADMEAMETDPFKHADMEAMETDPFKPASMEAMETDPFKPANMEAMETDPFKPSSMEARLTRAKLEAMTTDPDAPQAMEAMMPKVDPMTQAMLEAMTTDPDAPGHM